MILAAGLGTRLRPLTDDRPKALVEVGGVPMLERVAVRLIEAGADRLVINAHHFAERVEEFVRSRDGWGVEYHVSVEPERPLETGGGLLQASRYLRGDAPFFFHNADILSDLPLDRMYRQHLESGALATLATMRRDTSRYLLFDDGGLLGRVDRGKGLRIQVREPVGEERALAFAGVHVISPELPGRITEQGVFSILDPYLRLAGEGERIESFPMDGWRWLDVGKPEQLEAAQRWDQQGGGAA